MYYKSTFKKGKKYLESEENPSKDGKERKYRKKKLPHHH